MRPKANEKTQVASRDAVLSAIRSAEADVVVAEAEKQAAEATLQTAQTQTQVAKSQLNELKLMLEYATIRAPFRGLITERNVNLGDLIDRDSGEDSDPLFTLSQVDQVRIQIPVPEVEAPLIQPGDAVELTFPSFVNEPPITTTVTRIAGSLDRQSRTMLVEAELKNPDRKLLPGMFGEARIKMDAQVATRMLPSRAVRFDEDGNAYVYAVDHKNRVSVIEVATGRDTGTHIEIVSGIETGQRVVDSHLQRFP